ncbi:reverse transcriptase domain-containing protein [Tanacetum coccineum]
MPTIRQSISSDAIEELIAQRTADTLATYETNWNTGNGNGNGSGSQSDGGSGSIRTMHMDRGCTYKEFLNCQPLNFKGTKGAVGLTYWFEKIEYVFHIKNCVVECQVKYATCTLLKDLMKMMIEAYCPRNEIQKLESELWNLTVKGTDVVGYTQWFQELALLCPRMVPKEDDKVERYIWGLLDIIQGNVTSVGPVRLQDVVKLANSLMDQKVYNVARAYTVVPGEKSGYASKLPLFNKFKLHHNGPCTVKCSNCKKVGHMTWDCWSLTAVANQRSLMANFRTLTCFECDKQRHYPSECPKLKNQNRGNQVGSSEARGRVYAL